MRGLVTAVAVMLVLPGLSGCLGLGGVTCYGISSTFHQEGAFDAFPAEDEHEGWSIEWDLQPESLPFENTSLNALIGPERYFLVSVEWQGPELDASRGGAPLFSLSPDGLVEARANERVEEDELIGAFETFIANVSDADEQTRSAWADAFVASPQHESTMRPAGGEPIDLFRYATNVTEPYRFEELVDEQEVPWPVAFAQTSPGGFTRDAGDWTFSIAFPVKHADNQQGSGEHAEQVTVDEFDQVQVLTAQEENDFETTRTLVEENFNELGLPAPEGLEPEDARVDTVC